MANAFASIHFDTSRFTAAMDDVKRAETKASMYGVRSVGRAVARAAKAQAPVYHGSDPRAMAESGNLRKSIKNARRMDRAGDTYQLKVGPFGSKKKGTAVTRYGIGPTPSVKAGTSTKGQVRGVQLYRAKMEAKYGYMAAGVSSVDVEGIFEAAYAKAFARFR